MIIKEQGWVRMGMINTYYSHELNLKKLGYTFISRWSK